MKFLRLIVANLQRKKVRTTLTIGSFAVALFLYGILVAIRGAFSQGVDVAGADRLVVINRVSLIQPLPFAYRDKIAKVPGVKAISYATWFGGIYQDPKNFFPQYAVEPESWHDMYPEYLIPEEQWRAFMADRQGCIVGAATARRFGFELGDRIPIQGSYLPGMYEFNVRGIYKGKRPDDDNTQFWFRRDYLDEMAPGWYKGLVGWYVVRLTDPDQAAPVMKAIDEGFANSPFETKTDTEKAFAASFAKQVGNIELLVLIIGGVVFFTLLLVTANTMAIAVRERTGELAVLKTVGFADGLILGLVLAESTVVALAGGVLGILAAAAVAPGLGRALPGMTFILPPAGLGAGLALSLAVGLCAGLLPALSAMRLRVVDALRRV